MPSAGVLIFLFSLFNVVLLQGIGSGTNGNLRLCIVEGRGSYKRAPKFCPVLDEQNSGVECVIGVDRLDCLRRISKGTVDFGVFSPEDLVAAQWADVNVLVTNELRHRDRPFERRVVAVVQRRILPEHSSGVHAVLRNSTLCHPGVGSDDIRPLSDTLSGYLESLVLEKSCDPELSMTENRIKSLAGYFSRACKAGPWVPDVTRDRELKKLYPSLCAACGSPSICSTGDRYWGDSGALQCIGEGSGDVTWAEYDDVDAYFGLTEANRRRLYTYPPSDHVAYLCRDGSWQPLKDNPQPCVWLNRPWTLIVSKRKTAEAVSRLTSSLMNSTVVVDTTHWEGALAMLLESGQSLRRSLQPPKPPMDYLASAKGFVEAYSQSGCHPPRHVTMCTKSLMAKNKCEWLSEAGAVYGIQPPLQCVKVDDVMASLKAVQQGQCDVAIAPTDLFVDAVRDYSLTPVLHEATPIVEQMDTVMAYVKKGSNINKMADLRGKRAAFPRYDGFAWHAVLNYVQDKEKINCNQFLDYFESVCAPGVEKVMERYNLKDCYMEGEAGPLKALVDGVVDVAFVKMATFNAFAGKHIKEIPAELKDIVPVCPEENDKYCFVSWANIGHVFASKNVTSARRHEIINVLTKLDQLFGKHPPFHTPMFSMYGSFNHHLDVLFHNNTRMLATDLMLRTPYNRIPLNYERRILNVTDFTCSSALSVLSSSALIVFVLVVNAFS